MFNYLLLDKVPLVLNSQQPITGVSKHLCGAATGAHNFQQGSKDQLDLGGRGKAGGGGSSAFGCMVQGAKSSFTISKSG